MTIDPDLDAALSDVRRAYRLVWSYQRRIFDMVQLIAAKFPTHQFYVWETLDRERPVQRTTDPLRKWAWDLLPLYRTSFLFLPSEADRNRPKCGEWMLEVNVTADTGWDGYTDRGEPDAVRFEDATASASNLTLHAWQCTADTEINFNHLWRNNEWPEEDNVPKEHPDAHFRVARLTFNLASLPDENAVEETVKAFKAMILERFNISVDA